MRPWLLPSIAAVVAVSALQRVEAGAYVFADATRLDLVAHPQVYSGIGGERPDLTICIDSSVNPALAAQAEPAVIKAVETFNRLRSIPDNNLAFNANTDMPSGRVDFESTLLHEMGHCQGLAHPNHATESGLPEPDRNGTKSTNGVDGAFNQGAGPDARHGSSDDLRGDDVNLHWYIRNQNNPGLLPGVADSSTMIRALTALPAGHAFAANADRDVMAALGFPLTEAVMQQGAFTREAQRHLQNDDVLTLLLARSGVDRSAGTSDDYRYRLRYVGQLNNPPNADCNLRVRLDTSTSFAVCSVSGSFIVSGQHIRITRAEMAFNSSTNWYFTPGVNTVTTVTSTSPSPGTVGEPYSVSVTVREAPGIVIAGEPRGVVEVSDGVPAPDTSTCTIHLAGTVNETGSCQLTTNAPGTREVHAQFLGFAGWDASAGTRSHSTQPPGNEATVTSILSSLPSPSVVGQPYLVTVQVSAGAGTPTGSVVVGDGQAECSIASLAGGQGSCSLTSHAAGLRTLTASYAGDTGFNPSQGTASHPVDPSPTTVSVLSNLPNPSRPGQPVSVSYAVAAASPGAGEPAGVVTVSASGGPESCSGTVAEGQCSLVLQTLGDRSLAVSYLGSPDFLPSQDSTPQAVALAATTTSVTSHTPEPSVVGQPYRVGVRVESPGGVPTGTVVVDEGAASCETAPLVDGEGECELASYDPGNRLLTASYAPQDGFAASSDSVGHGVGKADSLTIIERVVPSPASEGSPVEVEFLVVAMPPSAGTPGGSVSVSSDAGGDCIATVTEASCSLQPGPIGTRQIEAVYAGDSRFHPSSDATFLGVTPAEDGIFADGFEAQP